MNVLTSATVAGTFNASLGTGDSPATGTTLAAGSIRLCAPTDTAPNCNIDASGSVVIANQGTYTLNPTTGVITFDPLPTFTGPATAVTYSITDALGQKSSTTYTPTVGAPPAPTVLPDAQSTGYDVTQTYNPTSNDTANTNFPLNVTTVKLCQPATTTPPVPAQVPPNCDLTTLTTDDGVYTVNTTTGAVEFNPAASFTGTVATPIIYQAKDSINRTVNSTITPTIGLPPQPTAVPDTSTGAFDTNQSITPLPNDQDTDAIPLLPATLKLCGNNPVQTPNNCTQTSLFVPGQGSYVVDPATGIVTFDPLPTFSGNATPIKYQAANKAGQTVDSTISVFVADPPLPVTKPDSSTSAMKVVQTVNPLGNDTPGVPSIPLDPKTVKLCAVANPSATPPISAEVSPNCTKTTLEIPGKGTFTVDAVTGIVSFTPIDTWHGTVPTIDYTVTDTLGRKVSSQINIVVLPPPAMAAFTDLSSGEYNTPQAIDPLTNDSPGDLTAPELSAYTSKGSVAKVPSSVRFCGPDVVGTAVDESVSPNCVATSITTGAGTYVVNTTTGIVTFTPLATFTGTDPNAPTYQTCNLVTGNWQPATPPAKCASALIIPTVGPPPMPVASPNTSSNSYDTNQVINPLTNDTANTNFPLDPTTVKLCGAGQTPNACDKTTLEVSNQGTYTLNPVTGVVTFDPLPSFTGPATQITYQVTDSLNRTVSSTINVTVGPPPAPTATNDTNSGPYDQDQTITPLSNDSAITAFPLGQTTVKLCGPDDATTSGVNESVAPNCVALSVTTVDGVYTVNTNGTVTFNPDADFTGTTTAPVTYQATDMLLRTVNATITPTVTPPPAPTATNNTSTGAYDQNQVISPLANDTPGVTSLPLLAATLKLCQVDDLATTGVNEAQSPNNCTATSVTIPGEGTYTVNSDGTVTFNPLPSFTGTVQTPVRYQVADGLGRVVNATITPSVTPPPAPVASPDTTSGLQDVNQSIIVTANDAAGTGSQLVTASVVLTCGSLTSPDCVKNANGSVTMAGQGTYSASAANGTVVFDPEPSYTGTARPVTYTVKDLTNQSATSTYTPTVIPAPVAVDDNSVDGKDINQVISVLGNDTTPAGSNTYLVPSTLKLCGTNPVQTAPTCTLTTLTTADGTYTVNSTTGDVTFDPNPTFVGTVTVPVDYQVSDNGSTVQTVTATITPTVLDKPTVRPDTTSAGWDVTQSINVVTDVAGTGTTNDAVASSDFVDPLISFEANSITIDCALAANCTETVVNGVVTEVIMAGQGTYTVDRATNVITFNPVDTFTGTALPVTYSISDDLNQTSSTTYTPTVIVPPAPTASPDTVELLPGQSKVFSSIFDGQTGDTDPALATTGAGAPGFTNSTVCIIDPATSVCDTDGIVTIPGQGTYTLNSTTGIVTYAALSTATPGAKTPVTYKITDGLGRSVTSTLTPSITPAPVANPDFSSGVQGAIQTLSPVGNDRPGGGTSTELFPDTRAQIPSGIFLCAANQPPPDCAASTVTVTDPVTNATLGVLTVAASGLVTFTPEPNFVGTTPPIGYQIPDNLGQKAYSTITITVVPPPAPSATIDTGSAEYNKPVTLKPWINDSAGSIPAGSSAPAPSLIATSIKLCGDNSTFVAMSTTPADCTATKVKTVEGTYEVNAITGEVVFTPNPNMVDPITGLATGKGFVGTVKYPPTYQIWNNWTGLGGAKSATALLVPTIAPPGAPAATVDITKTKPGTSVVLNPVSNDKPGTAALDPTTIRLCGTGEISPACTQMSVTTLDGLYVVDPTTGQVTFTPRDGFTGQATIPYIIKDGLGMMALSNLIITVEDTAVVPVAKKTKVGLAKTGGTRPDLLLLLGLVAIAAAGGLRVLGRKK
jgi:CshA-type fibril repeat protein